MTKLNGFLVGLLLMLPITASAYVHTMQFTCPPSTNTGNTYTLVYLDGWIVTSDGIGRQVNIDCDSRVNGGTVPSWQFPAIPSNVYVVRTFFTYNAASYQSTRYWLANGVEEGGRLKSWKECTSPVRQLCFGGAFGSDSD